jgi:hypothetical protein
METNTSTGCVPKYEKAQLATSRILLWNACMASILVGTELLFRERVDQYHGRHVIQQFSQSKLERSL